MARPIVTATVQAAILSATSNVLAQALAAFREGSPPYIDFIRVLHFILFAALSCPPNYMWQRFLEESFPQWTDAGQSPREGVEKGSNGARRLNLGNTAKKVALDQTLGAAVNTVLFIAVMGSLKGADMQEVVRLIRRDFYPVMKDGWKLWPAVSLVLFTAVPFERRLLVGGLVSVGWGIYLSLVAAR